MAIGYVEWVNPNALPTGLTCFMGVQSVGFLATLCTGIHTNGTRLYLFEALTMPEPGVIQGPPMKENNAKTQNKRKTPTVSAMIEETFPPS